MSLPFLQSYLGLSNSLQTAQGGEAPIIDPTRGVFGGGLISVASDIIDYITIATTGNATDFGDLTVARYASGGVNSSTRGVFGGGDAGAASNVMDYITIATTGNATDFGDLTFARRLVAGIQNGL